MTPALSREAARLERVVAASIAIARWRGMAFGLTLASIASLAGPAPLYVFASIGLGCVFVEIKYWRICRDMRRERP